MRTAAGWAVVGVLGIAALTAGAPDDPVAPPPPPLPPLVLPANPVAPAAATPAPVVTADPPDAETAALLKALGSERYREREKAGEALEAKGDKALPHLRRALATTDNPEVARRLAVMVRRMDNDRLVAPKRITLSVKDKPAKAVFDEIARQTGYKIEFNDNNGFPGGTPAKFSFEFDKAPFWQVIDRVADAANLQVYAESDDETIRINPHGNTSNPHVCYAGPFRLVAQTINASKSVQLAGVTRQGVANTRSVESLGLNFQLYSEPKNPILGTTNYQADVLVAVDETGATLVPPKDHNNGYQSRYYQNSYRGHAVSGNLNLVRGTKDATTIKTLRGKVGVILLAGVVPEVVVADPLKAKTKTVVGRTVEVTFDSMTEANGQYTVNLTVKKLGADEQNVDYNWSNTLWQKIEVVDEKGVKFRTYGPQNQNNNGVSVQYTIVYGADGRGGGGPAPKLGKPAKLVVNEWLQVTHEVTFEFKDIPLP